MPAMALDRDTIFDALGTVNDPELHRDLLTLGRVRDVRIEGEAVTVEVQVDRMSPDRREALRQEIEAAIRSSQPQADSVEVKFSARLTASASGGGQTGAPSAASPAPPAAGGGETGNPLPNVKHVLAVGAGKGGVGKSTVAAAIAIGLARHGQKVGLLDGDIYGPSMPTMLGTDRYEPRAVKQTLLPFEVHGIKAMSIGALVEDDDALIWRGPMAHGAFRQLATQTDWGELDVLVIDLPPGTGDVPLTMSQLLQLTGAIIVCTPQKVAQDDARRAAAMFDKLGVPVLGLVENMSYFIGDDGKEYDLFGKGGAELLAQRLGVPFLGAVPIHRALRRNADAGDPVANFTTDDALASDLNAMVRRVSDQIVLAGMQHDADAPTLTVQ